MKTATDELTQATYKIAEEMYSKAGGGPGAPGAGMGGEPPKDEGKKKDDVVDAEFTEKK